MNIYHRNRDKDTQMTEFMPGFQLALGYFAN